MNKMAWRNEIRIGVSKQVPAHSITNGDNHITVPQKFYDANLVWKEVDQKDTVELNNPESLMALTVEQAQTLMEGLWNAGVRPSQAMGSVGQLGAVEKHLADMRALTEHVLQCKLTGR